MNFSDRDGVENYSAFAQKQALGSSITRAFSSFVFLNHFIVRVSNVDPREDISIQNGGSIQ